MDVLAACPAGLSRPARLHEAEPPRPLDRVQRTPNHPPCSASRSRAIPSSMLTRGT